MNSKSLVAGRAVRTSVLGAGSGTFHRPGASCGSHPQLIQPRGRRSTFNGLGSSPQVTFPQTGGNAGGSGRWREVDIGPGQPSDTGGPGRLNHQAGQASLQHYRAAPLLDQSIARHPEPRRTPTEPTDPSSYLWQGMVYMTTDAVLLKFLFWWRPDASTPWMHFP